MELPAEQISGFHIKNHLYFLRAFISLSPDSIKCMEYANLSVWPISKLNIVCMYRRSFLVIFSLDNTFIQWDVAKFEGKIHFLKKIV